MNEVQVFNSPTFGQVRTAGNPDNPLFCLSDVCEALGLTAKGVKQRLDDEVISNYPISDTLGRQQSMLFVNEDGLYDVILDSRKPEARAFRKWVTSEVLPSIRKTGNYLSTPTLPQNYKQALQQLLASVEQNEQLQLENNELQQDVKNKQQEIDQQRATIVLQEHELKESAPKAEYYDNVLQAKNTYTSTVVAKELGMRHAEQLHRELQKRNILFHACGQWVLTAKYCQKDYTRTRTHTFVRNDGSQGTSTITVWTEAGRFFLHKVFNV